jgi:hypothetical protein
VHQGVSYQQLPSLAHGATGSLSIIQLHLAAVAVVGLRALTADTASGARLSITFANVASIQCATVLSLDAPDGAWLLELDLRASPVG